MFNTQEMWPSNNRFVNKGGKKRSVSLSWTERLCSLLLELLIQLSILEQLE